MKKIMLSIALVCMIGVYPIPLSVGTSTAPDMFLTLEQPEQLDDYITQLKTELYGNTVATISDGIFSGFGSADTSYTWKDRSVSGQAYLNLQGTYDRTKEIARGTYNITYHLSYDPSPGFTKIGETSSYTGTFENHFSYYDTRLILNLKGRVTSTKFYSDLKPFRTVNEAMPDLFFTTEHVRDPIEYLGEKYTKDSDPAIEIRGVTGDVRVLYPGDSSGWVPVTKNMKLPPGTIIKTGEGSNIILKNLEQEAAQYLGSNSSMLVLPPLGSLDRAVIIFGKWLRYENRSPAGKKNPNADAETNWAIVGTLGTIYSVTVQPDSTIVAVVDGKVEVVSRITQEKVTVEAEKQITLNENGLGEITVYTPDELEQELVTASNPLQILEQETETSETEGAADNDKDQPLEQSDKIAPDKSGTLLWPYLVIGLAVIVIILAIVLTRFRKKNQVKTND